MNSVAKMSEKKSSVKTLHIAMYPWFAMGHLTSFLHISNKLAERGHKISFFTPAKAQSKLQHFNLHLNLITFIPITVPQVDGLPFGAETTADVPRHLHHLLMTAMDLTQPTLKSHLITLKPYFIFFDFTHWIPALSRSLNIKSVQYCTTSSVTIGYLVSPERRLLETELKEEDLMQPPPGFPQSCIKLRAHEARVLTFVTSKEYGGVSFSERISLGFSDCDAIGFKTCREIEGPYCDYIEKKFGRPVILAGPVLPDPPSCTLDGRWDNWLNGFDERSVILCAFGSECVLKKDQFQELLLGLELTGQPFLAALKPPEGEKWVESALPEGFKHRVGRRGVVHGGWVQQQLILGHPSVGCFVTHCGSGSLSEAMVNECQLVLLPHVGDQFINARMMSRDLRVGVEVEKGEEDGLFTRYGVCQAVKSVLEDDSEIGREVRANHAKWRAFLLSEGLEKSYIDGFIHNLHRLF